MNTTGIPVWQNGSGSSADSYTENVENQIRKADGKLKKADNPKKKKLKHVQLIKRTDDTITGRINDNAALTNEDIKYAIKKYIADM